MENHTDNQSAAAAAGAIPHLMQLTKSSNAALSGLPIISVMALALLISNHHDNQSAAAAAGAVPHLMQLAKSSNVDLQERAVNAL